MVASLHAAYGSTGGDGPVHCTGHPSGANHIHSHVKIVGIMAPDNLQCVQLQ